MVSELRITMDMVNSQPARTILTVNTCGPDTYRKENDGFWVQVCSGNTVTPEGIAEGLLSLIEDRKWSFS